MTYANNLIPEWAKYFVVERRSTDEAVCISFFKTQHDDATFIPGSKTLPRPISELQSLFAPQVAPPAPTVPHQPSLEQIENIQDDYDNLRAEYNGLLSQMEKLKTFGAAVCLELPDAITPVQGAFMRLLLSPR